MTQILNTPSKQQWKVPSRRDARKKYKVTRRGRRWSCNCGHWIHTQPRPKCFHIQEVQASL